MWQEIAVYLVGVITLFYIIRKIKCFILSAIRNESRCEGCAGCAIKVEKKEKIVPEEFKSVP